MIVSVLAAADFVRPHVDWLALAPEIIIVATIAAVLLIDVFTDEHQRSLAPSVAGIGSRSMLGGAYVVDDFALVLKGLFLVAGYLTVLLSTNDVAEGDYAEGEYYLLLLSSVFGMIVMASSRDLIGIFISLEMLSIPVYLLAGWRKRTLTGNEAGVKYYLIGVFATGVMLYGMSLVFGGTGSTLLTAIGTSVNGSFGKEPVAVLGILFTLIGFGFKVSAVPFHNWAPDTYEGAPTPVTAFLSVATKAAGFVAILELVFVGFYGRADIIRPFIFILAVLTMTVGNVIALRQTNIVRLFAYSSVAQAGFIIAPLAVFGSGGGGTSRTVLSSIVTYLLAYTVMNLGVFGVIIAVSRKLGTGEIKAWGGLFTYAPGLASAMGLFLFGLGGIPPAMGWFAKFQLFTAVISPHTALGYAMGVILAINSVISLAYYLSIMRTMFMDDVPDGDTTPVRVPISLAAVVTLCALTTLAVGVFPMIFSHLAKGAVFALG
jgi:NADH-quinone oxidoreductase subunit N